MTAAVTRAAPVMLAVGLAAVLLARDPSAAGVVGATGATILVALSVVDAKRRVLPNRIVLPGAALVLALHCALVPDRALEWVLAALGTAGFLLVLHAAYPQGLGVGDVKLGLLLGALLGRGVAAAMLVGTLAAAAAGVVLIARRGLEARKYELPFGAFLAFGALVVLLLGR